jgi:hypothetical protein
LGINIKKIWAKLQVSGFCWHYGDYKHKNHATVYFAGRRIGVHKVVYEYLVGLVPEGYKLDHVCRNKRCVNPDHLEPVTHSENIKRAWKYSTKQGFEGAGKRSKVSTHCRKGHNLSDVGVLLSKRANGTERKKCRACQHDAQERWRRKAGIPERGRYFELPDKKTGITQLTVEAGEV